MRRVAVNHEGFNAALDLPYALRIDHVAVAMADIYELLATLNRDPH